MFENYIKVAWRNLFRNKGFSLTNILGLTIGMTCTMLILLWVRDELGYDKFHSNYNNIYQVIANRDFKNQMMTDRNMVLPLASSLEAKYPQVKYAVVTTYNNDQLLAVNNTKLSKSGMNVSVHFFNMYSWKFLKGSPATALKEPSSIILTESAAIALFGKEDPINKMVRVDNHKNAKVVAILADPPGNSTFQFDFLQPFDYSDSNTTHSMSEWINSSWQVFVQPVEGANLAKLTKNVNKLKAEHDPKDKISTYFLFPMTNWRLYSNFKNGKADGGMIDYVKLFSLIAVIILLTACINFMNLSTARSEKRAKEVGIRKTLGSEKWQLVLQFFIESIILAAIAFVLSAIAVSLLLPAFNLLVDKKLSLPLDQSFFWLASLCLIVVTGIIAGSYPALYLSSFNPVKTLKGTFLTGTKAALPRHILVVGQFVISILLISATLIVYLQIQYVKNKSIGYDKNNLLSLVSSPLIDKNYAAVKNDLLSTGTISAVTRAGTSLTQVQWRSGPPDWDGKPANSMIIFSCMSTDMDMAKTLGIRFVEGKDFSGTPSDSSSIILNEAAVKVMGLKHPLGMELRYGKKFNVIGVSENIVMGSPFKPVDPTMIFYNSSYSQAVTVRLKAGVSPQKAIAAITAVYSKYSPEFPLSYSFVDQEFGKKFITEELISKLTNIFAGLAIFICCIGIAGLASFTIEKRIREIGIRKVLGATVQQVLMLISTQFLKLALIAFVIAVPLTWWMMTKWLSTYEYKITISIWLFVAVGFLILLLTLVVVGLNTLRAAMSNPVKSLHTQ